ncbi:COX15/CtaA family protein [Ornithinimicrobium pekingense]|uniref:Protein required for cytochrome oxidase assembly n=1 Tax=Ornithinimicrobium pekingense TaxID=384677 RepID=A0ABQ2F9G7_9MICO|nr:COX15/CtaA family protein [Ornithinimicrobium pekingense]GGK74715.1 protein required for cytochrome oxidase assembly [Ornithinimicrobium pekingense]
MTSPTSTTPTAAGPGPRGGGAVRAFLMPTTVTGWVRATAWASMLANALLIVTGGAVRLTGSGLGCPTWPRCTDASWTNTPEMGVHGYIEFGNRTLTFLLVAISVLTFLAVWRTRDRHPSFVRIAVAIGLGIILQAAVGGITVRTGLNPWVVGVHFVISTVLVALAAVLVARTRRVSLEQVAVSERAGQLGGPERGLARGLAGTIAVSGALTIYLGTLVTGTGPHSGDAGEVARHAFDPYVVTRVHVVPVYVMVAATLAALAVALRRGWPAPVRRVLLLLGALLLAQAALGYYQFFNGVPVLAVGLHMAGAAALAAVITLAVEKVYAVSRPAGETAGRTARQDVLTDA